MRDQPRNTTSGRCSSIGIGNTGGDAVGVVGPQHQQPVAAGRPFGSAVHAGRQNLDEAGVSWHRQRDRPRSSSDQGNWTGSAHIRRGASPGTACSASRNDTFTWHSQATGSLMSSWRGDLGEVRTGRQHQCRGVDRHRLAWPRHRHRAHATATRVDAGHASPNQLHAVRPRLFEHPHAQLLRAQPTAPPGMQHRDDRGIQVRKLGADEGGVSDQVCPGRDAFEAIGRRSDIGNRSTRGGRGREAVRRPAPALRSREHATW